jgi:hypothetical protein
MVKNTGPLVPGTSVKVDSFNDTNPGIYVLTHFHADHYQGLHFGSGSWNAGPLICTPVTARLIRRFNMVHRLCEILELSPGEDVRLIDPLSQQVVRIALTEANHCAGSAMVIAETDGGVYINSGDVRVFPGMFEDPLLLDVRRRGVQRLILDYTWASPNFAHLPLKEESVSQLLEIATEHLEVGTEQLILQSHGLGDEDILLGLRERLPTGEKIIFVDERRFRTLGVTHGSDGFEIFDEERSKGARVFVVRNHKQIGAVKKLGDERRVFVSCSTMWWKNMILRHPLEMEEAAEALRWGGSVQPLVDKHECVHVLYSMHSGLSELRELVRFLSPAELDGVCDSPADGFGYFNGPTACFADLVKFVQEDGAEDADDEEKNSVPMQHRCRCPIARRVIESARAEQERERQAEWQNESLYALLHSQPVGHHSADEQGTGESEVAERRDTGTDTGPPATHRKEDGRIILPMDLPPPPWPTTVPPEPPTDEKSQNVARNMWAEIAQDEIYAARNSSGPAPLSVETEEGTNWGGPISEPRKPEKKVSTWPQPDGSVWLQDERTAGIPLFPPLAEWQRRTEQLANQHKANTRRGDLRGEETQPTQPPDSPCAPRTPLIDRLVSPRVNIQLLRSPAMVSPEKRRRLELLFAAIEAE